MADTSDEPSRRQHYATFGLGRSARQIIHAVRSRRGADHEVDVRHERLERNERRIRRALGRDIADLDIFIVGAGSQLAEARYFGRKNSVTALNLDVIPVGPNSIAYFQMLRRNGFGRFAKTLGRKVLGVDHAFDKAWKKALSVDRLPIPHLLVGDIQDGLPASVSYDIAVSWSVFQHLPDPELALRNLISGLRPGGVLFTGIHIWTSNSGHHDIRVFSGKSESLPPWGHLRKETEHLVEPSAYLNRWRLPQWRELFSSLTPVFEEYLETYDDRVLPGRLEELRGELEGYDDDELLTVDAFFVWKKS